eukprot:jgi/Ulvmu1/3949/UM018_0172.1
MAGAKAPVAWKVSGKQGPGQALKKGPPRAGAPVVAGKSTPGIKAKHARKPAHEPGPRDKAATILQAYIRGHLARISYGRLKQAKLTLDQEMQTLQQQAYKAEVAYERKQEAQRRAKQEEATKRKREQARIQRALLEAAFDDEVVAVKSRLEEGEQYFENVVDSADAHGNTLLSEAAAGGALATAELLLQRGANPNSQGEFKRTPLWRAAFLGKLDLVLPLLSGGADPRIPNEGGELPEHVAASLEIKQQLQEWDTARTDELLHAWQQKQEAVAALVQERRAAELKTVEGTLAAAQDAHSAAQGRLQCVRADLEKRISEHDTCVVEARPDTLVAVTLQMIKEQEAAVAEAAQEAQVAMEALTAAKQAVRQQQADAAGGDAGLPGHVVRIKELDDIVSGRGAAVPGGGEPPCAMAVIDTSSRAPLFFRYMDSNYLSALSPRDMEPQRVRRALLGALRYGKPLVIDLADTDLWPALADMFDRVRRGLLASVTAGRVRQESEFAPLVEDGDGEEYKLAAFQEARLARFRFVVCTALRFPDQGLLQAMPVFRVKAEV